MKVLQDECTHEVKVTFLGKKVGYGVRVFVNGELNQEQIAETKADIGRVARSMLRMEDKCGNLSDFADNARHRVTRKELQRRVDNE